MESRLELFDTFAKNLEAVNGTCYKTDKASKIVSIDIKEASEKEVSVEKIGNDLEISYLNFKRRFKLPDSVSSRKISSFSLKDNKLRIVMDYD